MKVVRGVDPRDMPCILENDNVDAGNISGRGVEDLSGRIGDVVVVAVNDPGRAVASGQSRCEVPLRGHGLGCGLTSGAAVEGPASF